MQNYHTGNEPIIVREFGRNFQKMILFAKEIEEREKRQHAIERIIDLILDMYPVNNRNIEDYKIKIWSHVLQICNYQLDVDIPEYVPAKKEKVKPDLIPYPEGKIRYRHYGKGIQRLIDKAVNTEDEEVREEMIRVIGAFMKMCYKNWNRDNASDDVVAQEMRTLSRGRIDLSESANINFLIRPQTKGTGINSINNQQKKIGSKQYKKTHYSKNTQQGGTKNRFKKNTQQGQAGQQQGVNRNFKKRK